MPRPLRIAYEGAWYHVLNRGTGRRAIFQSDDQRHVFLALLGDMTALWRRGLRLLAHEQPLLSAAAYDTWEAQSRHAPPQWSSSGFNACRWVSATSLEGSHRASLP
jgi:hypothetical protein